VLDTTKTTTARPEPPDQKLGQFHRRKRDSFVWVPAHCGDGPEQRYLTADGAGLCIPTHASP
jgi:hypothetical protein